MPNEKYDKIEPTECSVEVYSSSHKNQIPWKIYLSRALSAWGDRIWAFSVGIFMNKLAPEILEWSQFTDLLSAYQLLFLVL